MTWNRRSTNEKLADIINTNNRDKDEEAEIAEEEARAKMRLRRTVLYGCGARAKIPKVKKGVKADYSPFALTNAAMQQGKPKQIDSSIPPGAHTDAYRMVT